MQNEMKVNNKIASGGNVKSNSQSNERLLAFGFGVVFVVVMLAIALFVPNPTATQWFTFRVVLALAAAGIEALLPGLTRYQNPHGQSRERLFFGRTRCRNTTATT
jgi:hypothetical protein